MLFSSVSMSEATINNGYTQLYTMSSQQKNPEAEVVILLHSGPGFPNRMKEITDLLGLNYHVILFHQRGTMRSSNPENDYEIESYIDDITAVADYYKANKFHIFGHGWGGLLAQIYAYKNTDRVKSLFLLSSMVGTGEDWKEMALDIAEALKFKSSYLNYKRMQLNLFMMKLNYRSASKHYYRHFVTACNTGFPTTTAQLLMEQSNVMSAPIIKTPKTIYNYEHLPVVKVHDYKITIAYGDEDIYTFSRNILINRYPNAANVTIRNSGHYGWLHNPAEFKGVLGEHFVLTKKDTNKEDKKEETKEYDDSYLFN